MARFHAQAQYITGDRGLRRDWSKTIDADNLAQAASRARGIIRRSTKGGARDLKLVVMPAPAEEGAA
jgi:hypothetical protein